MKSLEELRKQLDALDEELLHILAKRVELSRKVGKLKKEYGFPLRDEKRMEALIAAKVAKAELLHMPKEFIKELYTLIHDHSVELQKK